MIDQEKAAKLRKKEARKRFLEANPGYMEEYRKKKAKEIAKRRAEYYQEHKPVFDNYTNDYRAKQREANAVDTKDNGETK